MRDKGIIRLDSERARSLGFTSDRFDGYLWDGEDSVTISFIVSKQEGKGNLSALFTSIEAEGKQIRVPTPFPHMEAILKRKGFIKRIERDHILGPVEVWIKYPHRNTAAGIRESVITLNQQVAKDAEIFK